MLNAAFVKRKVNVKGEVVRGKSQLAARMGEGTVL